MWVCMCVGVDGWVWVCVGVRLNYNQIAARQECGILRLAVLQVQSIIKRSLLQWNGCDFHVSTHDTIWFYRPGLPVLSYDNILKFDWHCQLSGSRNNSMKLCKLPGSSADSYTFLTAIASPTTQQMMYSHLLLTMPIAYLFLCTPDTANGSC